MKHLLGLIPASLLGALALAACGSSSHQPTVPSLTAGGHPAAHAAAAPGSLRAWRAAVACARRHGMPDLPDPALGPDGEVTLSGLSQMPTPTPAVQAACATQLQALQNSGSTHAIESVSDLHALLRVAACMRRHGYPDWPDPSNRGEFHVFSAAAGTPAKLNAAISACNSLFPASGWHLNVTPSGQ
jgi:hypothetical protein